MQRKKGILELAQAKKLQLKETKIKLLKSTWNPMSILNSFKLHFLMKKLKKLSFFAVTLVYAIATLEF